MSIKAWIALTSVARFNRKNNPKRNPSRNPLSYPLRFHVLENKKNLVVRHVSESNWNLDGKLDGFLRLFLSIESGSCLREEILIPVGI